MSPGDVSPQEEQLADILAAFDAALAAGAPPPGNPAPAALQPRLEEDLECLQLLHRLRSGAPEDKETRGQGDKETIGQGDQEPRIEPGALYTLTPLDAQVSIGQSWPATPQSCS